MDFHISGATYAKVDDDDEADDGEMLQSMVADFNQRQLHRSRAVVDSYVD